MLCKYLSASRAYFTASSLSMLLILRAITTALMSSSKTVPSSGMPLYKTVLSPPFSKNDAASDAPVKSSAIHPQSMPLSISHLQILLMYVSLLYYLNNYLNKKFVFLSSFKCLFHLLCNGTKHFRIKCSGIFRTD